MESINVDNKIIRITKHALHRANKREITIDDIKDALTNYKSFRRCKLKGKEDSFRLLGRNGIILIINLERDVIITLMRDNKQYARSNYKKIKNKRQLENKKLYGNRAKK